MNRGFFQEIVRVLASRWIRWWYRCEEPLLLPEGGCVVVVGHLTWKTAILLQVNMQRPLRLVSDASAAEVREWEWILCLLGAERVHRCKGEERITAVNEALKRGEVVSVFPENAAIRKGTDLYFESGVEAVASGLGVKMIPVQLTQIGSDKCREHWNLAVGKETKESEKSLRELLQEVGEQVFRERDDVRLDLGRLVIEGLKRTGKQVALVDGLTGESWSGEMLLSMGMALAEEIDQWCLRDRVGIVLPTGLGATVANLAVVFAGKVPVNLNFTAGRKSVEAALRIGEIGHVITAESFKGRLPEFPWPAECLNLEKLLPNLRSKILGYKLLVNRVSAKKLADRLELPDEGGERLATLLFTSGSSGEPKGVMLSHRNVVGNVAQFSTMLQLSRKDSVLACLPIFHSFGSTVTLWYPMICGVKMVTYPNPSDVVKGAELIERHGVTLLCSTPTFLRGYLRKAKREQLASLKLIVTGAERLPMELADAFEERFGKEVMQGYGLTETSPVVSVNLPDAEVEESGQKVVTMKRRGSVGKLATGMNGEIRDVETGVRSGRGATGMLWLRGINIFEGYLGDEKRSAEVLQNGWFKTGDLGRFDEDGFLYIEGRVSRFSKIGGEMVPHETIETGLLNVLGWSAEERKLVVTGVPDAVKGESLVVLVVGDVDSVLIGKKMQAEGFPNLWIPKRFRQVDEIPHLATGKLDLRKIQEIAAQEE